jgi:LysM repeat protein
MEEIDVGHYVLPALLTLLILGTFFIFVTSGGSDDERVDRPARSPTPTSTSTTAAKPSKPATTTPEPVPASSGRFTKVQPGDTPTSIADRSGISTERLLELNPSVDPGALKPGQTLKLAR